ncbi:Ger(x)C family spore germination protein [Lutibacter sp. B2]|nr:Ger(x)C family spore germination protein [Lutibacter sp. B2]
MRKLKLLIISVMSIVIITGCWDKVEIDKRAFVALIGIDKFENNADQKKDKKNRYTVTIAYPNTGVIAGKGQGEPKFIYTSTGENFSDIINGLNTRLGKTTFFRHTKAIILGEKLAKDEKLFREVLDVIERSPELGRKIHLIIAKGEAKEILDTSTKDETVLGLFIRELMEQTRKTPRIADADLGYILRSLHESHTAITPKIVSSKDEFKIAGAAVLKDFKMIGWLGELETKDLMFMQDKIKSSEMNVVKDDIIIALRITDVSTKMRVYEEEGEIVTHFDVDGEANIQQHLFEVRDQPLDHEYLEKIGNLAAGNIKEEIKTTYKKIQDDYQADLVQAGESLRKHEPDTWDKVKENWDEIFPTTKVKVDVKIKVRRAGVTK